MHATSFSDLVNKSNLYSDGFLTALLSVLIVIALYYNNYCYQYSNSYVTNLTDVI